jgi:hypothetical protein
LIKSFKPTSDDNKTINNLFKSQNKIDFLILPYFMTRSKNEVEILLKQLKTNGVFFIRELEFSFEDYKYELSVFFKSNVFHLKILIDEHEQCSVENTFKV